MNRKGFSLNESLLSLFILIICISLLTCCIYAIHKQKGMMIDETINKEWFYSP